VRTDWVSGTPPVAKRILVGLDFLPPTEKALAAVLDAVSSTETEVELVYVVDFFTETFILGNERMIDQVDAIRIDAGRELRVRADAARARGIRCSSTILVGLPGLALARHADRTGADVVVLGLVGGSRYGERSTWVTLAAARLLHHRPWHLLAPSSPRTGRARSGSRVRPATPSRRGR